MKPSKEAIEAAWAELPPVHPDLVENAINAFIAIEVAPLEQRIRDLEAGVASGVGPVVSENRMLHSQNEKLQQRIEMLEKANAGFVYVYKDLEAERDRLAEQVKILENKFILDN